MKTTTSLNRKDSAILLYALSAAIGKESHALDQLELRPLASRGPAITAVIRQRRDLLKAYDRLRRTLSRRQSSLDPDDPIVSELLRLDAGKRVP
jgi:hypothetical protein